MYKIILKASQKLALREIVLDQKAIKDHPNTIKEQVFKLWSFAQSNLGKI